jgi:hypothetical protein
LEDETKELEEGGCELLGGMLDEGAHDELLGGGGELEDGGTLDGTDEELGWCDELELGGREDDEGRELLELRTED